MKIDMLLKKNGCTQKNALWAGEIISSYFKTGNTVTVNGVRCRRCRTTYFSMKEHVVSAGWNHIPHST